jgi:chemotaxis protein CheD
MIHRVGLGGVSASRNSGDTLITYGLGSCVALVAHDRQTNTWALAHVVLPKAPPGNHGRDEPAYYAQGAVEAVMSWMIRMGARKELLRIGLVGGASVLQQLDGFDIGKRNALAVRKALWRHGIIPVTEDIGGDHSRTLKVEIRVTDGHVEVSNPDRGRWTLEEAL